MESFAKYVDAPKTHTCLLIDEAPVILLGRTFSEIVAAAVAFIACAYLDWTWGGLAAAIFVGGIMPMLRMRFPRGYSKHVLWGLGAWFPEMRMLTARKPVKKYGP
jgi:hypothetical protein